MSKYVIDLDFVNQVKDSITTKRSSNDEFYLFLDKHQLSLHGQHDRGRVIDKTKR